MRVFSLVKKSVYSILNVLFTPCFRHVLTENVRRFLVRILRRLNSHPFSCKLIGKYSACFFCGILATLIVEICCIDVKTCVFCNIRDCILRSLSLTFQRTQNRRNRFTACIKCKVLQLVCCNGVSKLCSALSVFICLNCSRRCVNECICCLSYCDVCSSIKCFFRNTRNGVLDNTFSRIRCADLVSDTVCHRVHERSI